MKNLLVFLTVCLGMISFAQTGPKIEFKEETINYGEVEKGKDDGIRIFEFTNTGDEPLLIKNAKSSCGCTVPEWPKEPIAPGAKAVIGVKYDTKRPGAFTKTVTITSNASATPTVLTIKGTVLPDEKAAEPTKS